MRLLFGLALVTAGFALSASAQSLYTPQPGAYISASDLALDYDSQLGHTRLIGAEVGYRLGNGVDLMLAGAGSESARTLALAPGLRYTTRVSGQTGIALSLRALASFREGYAGDPDEQGIGGLVSAATYTRVPLTATLEAFPQIGVSAGLMRETRSFSPELGPDTQPTLSLDARLPVSIGATNRLVISPTLSVPLLERSQVLVKRIVPGLGVGVSF